MLREPSAPVINTISDTVVRQKLTNKPKNNIASKLDRKHARTVVSFLCQHYFLASLDSVLFGASRQYRSVIVLLYSLNMLDIRSGMAISLPYLKVHNSCVMTQEGVQYIKMFSALLEIRLVF